MAVDRNTIETLNKKGESNSCIAKKLHIRRETVWKVVEKFKETGETCNRPGQAENEQSERSVWKTSEPILTKCRKGMNFQPLMNDETWQMSTQSESHERGYGAQFDDHWCGEIWR